MSFAEIKKSVNSDLNKPLDVLIKETVGNDTTNSLGSVIGKKTDSADNTSSASLFGFIKGIYNSVTNAASNILDIKNVVNTGGGVKIIKSIQHGYFNSHYLEVTVELTTAVNPSKCIVLLNGFMGGEPNWAVPSCVKNISATSLTIGAFNKNSLITNGSFSWQLIEFY